MTLVAILRVRMAMAETFRDFERRAAAIMARHGGRIERAVTVPGADGEELFREVHILTFPDGPAFDAYREDPELVALAHLRAASVIATEILIGVDGPDYHAPFP